MRTSTLAAAARGAGAGVLASIVQVGVGKAEEKLLLPPWEDADIAPRLVARVGEAVGERVPVPIQWLVGSAFHLGYAAAWGGAYGIAQRLRPTPPWLGGALLGGLIYALTFPRWGVAVRTGTEREPGRRSSRMSLVALSVAAAFGLATAFLYERVRPRASRE